MVADTLFRILHLGESGVMDTDPDNGPRVGAAHSRQWHRPRSNGAEPAANPGPVRPTMRTDAVEPRHQPPGDRGGDAIYSGCAGDDGPDDRTRWRAAPRLGTTTTAIADGVE